MENPGYVVYPDDMEENKLQPSQTESNPRLESKETPLQQSGGDCSTVAENNAVKKKTTKSETETPIDLQQSSSTTAGWYMSVCFLARVFRILEINCLKCVKISTVIMLCSWFGGIRKLVAGLLK